MVSFALLTLKIMIVYKFLMSVVKHKAKPTIGMFSICLIMQIPFVIAQNKANFTTAERAGF